MKKQDSFSKLIDKNAKSEQKTLRVWFVIAVVLFTLVMNLVAYIAMGDDYFTDYLGK